MMTGLDYIKHICEVIKNNPNARFSLAEDVATLPVGSIRTIRVGKSTIKYEVIAVDVDPVEISHAKHADLSEVHR